MLLQNACHLTYCTNIHPERSWKDLFESLAENLPKIKKTVAPEMPFGVGLRLSDFSSKEILEEKNLMKFKEWLDNNGLYVFTMNGFPYGLFHNKTVKDDVHKPDWNTIERVEYTKRLCRILAVLLPKNMEGGISTSPLSYKPWHVEEKKIRHLFKNAAIHLAMVAEEMTRIRKDTGKILHLDIEPEPDGLLERSSEVIEFYKQYLFVFGTEYLMQQLSVTASVAIEILKTHIRICYDICHFAVEYEDHEQAINNLTKEGIRIGKIQISSALKAEFGSEFLHSKKILDEFKKLEDKIYLHQVIERDRNDQLIQYNDFPKALASMNSERLSGIKEWRMHFHVPLFVETFGQLKSTQEDVVKVLNLLKENNITDHLEVETYTWDVLPEGLKTDLVSSIARELEWVCKQMEVSIEANE